MKSWRGLAVTAAALAVLAVVVVSFVAVGRHTAHAPATFDWEVASIFGTAVGTTLLALATGVLAASTWQDVRASRIVADTATKQLAQSQREHQERIRPVVIAGVRDFQPRLDKPRGQENRTLTGGWANVVVQNVGGGPAVRVTVNVVWAASGFFGDGALLSTESQMIPSLLVGEVTSCKFQFNGSIPEASFKDSDFWVVGDYYDRHGIPADPIRDWNRVVEQERARADDT